MATFQLSPAKAVLLAVQLASNSNLTTLRNLIFQHQKTLHTDLVLRILLSALPESYSSTKYVPFLQDLVNGRIEEDSNLTLDHITLGYLEEMKQLGEKEASKKVRKLHLAPLLWPDAPSDVPEDHVVQFLIHRSMRIDKFTGLLSQLPDLLGPFLDRSAYLRSWMITTVLPLLRLTYQYHPQESPSISIPAFETLDDEAGIAYLLATTGKPGQFSMEVGRDLKGLVGPWMYGNSRAKRRKLRTSSCVAINEIPVANKQRDSWEEVFKWIAIQASTEWKVAVQAVEQWDGPGDVDLGGYEDATEWLDEEDQQYLERRYARSALAAAYLVSDSSLEGLSGIHQILARIVTLLDLDRIPTLEAAGALLPAIPNLQELLSSQHKSFLREDHLKEENILTTPSESTLTLLHAFLISAYLFTKAGAPMTVRRAGELALMQQAWAQKEELKHLLSVHNSHGSRDDKYWIKTRNGILWLRNWGVDEVGPGRGPFGQIAKEEIEVLILKTLLSNSRVILAQSIYQNSSDPPLQNQTLQDSLIYSAKDAFDNASNGNQSRGGVKKSSEILKAFSDSLRGSTEAIQMQNLIKVADKMSTFTLVVKKQEGFRPVYLRVNDDPISLIAKILDQNPKSYLQINDMLSMSVGMVKAGLTSRAPSSGVHTIEPSEADQIATAKQRVTSFCIDAALGEDDFETAYSYVTTRLADVAVPAHAQRKSSAEQTEFTIPVVQDDWSWKAALEAGKYKFNNHNIGRPRDEMAARTAEIRHLEQRKDCLSHALRFAPPSALTSILSAFRRCEEELETKLKEEEEAEAVFDAQVDRGPISAMPGGFSDSPAPRREERGSSRPAEEAPMSIFDLSRATVTSARKGMSLFQGGAGGAQQPQRQRPLSPGGADDTGANTQESLEQRERKRDQLRNVAAGGLNAGASALAGGLSWVLGAPPAVREPER